MFTLALRFSRSHTTQTHPHNTALYVHIRCPRCTDTYTVLSCTQIHMHMHASMYNVKQFMHMLSGHPLIIIPQMYMGGKLVHADSMFNGYGTTRKDFMKQVSTSINV